MTKIHHLNCGTIRPYFPPGSYHIHCLLIESPEGLILIDTGFGTRDYTAPTPLVRWFKAALRVRDAQHAAIAQVRRLGHKPQDVRHIVMTHMHIDHAGGMPDFPWAKVHIYHKEYEAIQSPKGLFERFYIPAHWAHKPEWVQHHLKGDHWFGFDAVQIVDEPQICMVPLHGHSRGHCGIAIETVEGWLLHAGDSTYPLRPDKLGHPMLDFLVRPLLGGNISRLRELIRENGDEVQLINSHHGFVEFA